MRCRQRGFRTATSCRLKSSRTAPRSREHRGPASWGGALIGGLAFGGLGAVIGGLSGQRTSSTKVGKVDLRVIVNRTKAPVHTVNLMHHESETRGLLYNEAMRNATHWHSLIKVLINQADREDEATEAKSNSGHSGSAQTASVADELEKLGKLRDKGMLTDAEFTAQKTRLLR